MLVTERDSTTAIKKRFGSWNAAITAVGLVSAGQRDIRETELFDNLREVWITVGRQPRKRDMAKPASKYTHNPYVERYGGWLGAVKAFLASYEREATGPAEPLRTAGSRGPRDPSLRLRFLVMRRDSFRCRQWGASPAVEPRVELHVDHVVAWSAGGGTTMANLETLCAKCNLGESNLSGRDSG